MPGVVEFRDFDVGKVHVGKVTWTNVAHAKASIRFEKVSVDLLGSIEVTMKPSGWLGPGMTCAASVEFRPQVGFGGGQEGMCVGLGTRVQFVSGCTDGLGCFPGLIDRGYGFADYTGCLDALFNRSPSPTCGSEVADFISLAESVFGFAL